MTDEQYKRPGFTEVKDPELLEAITKLRAMCAVYDITIAGDFTVWVVKNDGTTIGYNQLEELSGAALRRQRRSLGQVKEQDVI